MNKQKLLIGVLLLIILGCVITSIVVIKNNNQEEEVIDNFSNINNQEVLKNAEVEGLTISNPILSAGENMSTFKAIVTNSTDKLVEFEKLYITFTTENGDIEVIGLSNVKIKTNDKEYINVSIDQDLTNVTKIEYRIEK